MNVLVIMLVLVRSDSYNGSSGHKNIKFYYIDEGALVALVIISILLYCLLLCAVSSLLATCVNDTSTNLIRGANGIVIISEYIRYIANDYNLLSTKY